MASEAPEAEQIHLQDSGSQTDGLQSLPPVKEARRGMWMCRVR